MEANRTTSNDERNGVGRQVASVDSLQKVSYRGEELYKKRAAHVNLEDSAQVCCSVVELLVLSLLFPLACF